MKKQLLKQRCLHAYQIGTGTASTATRICFNPSCSLGLTLGSLLRNAVAQWYSAGLETERLRVRASSASLRCVLEQEQ